MVGFRGLQKNPSMKEDLLPLKALQKQADLYWKLNESRLNWKRWKRFETKQCMLGVPVFEEDPVCSKTGISAIPKILAS